MSTALKQLGAVESVTASPQSASSGVTLLGATTQMNATLSMLENINLKANFIALNAAIEAARSQSQTENFTLVADQISRQAQRTEELAEKLRSEIGNLQRCALSATAVRYADIASDIIDKIDRNLFERNCDCQAWATFDSVVNCARKLAAKGSDEVREYLKADGADPASHRVIAQCNEQLQILMTTYQVYDDVFVINANGVVIAAAKRNNMIGTKHPGLAYVKEVRAANKVVVTDMHISQLTQQPAVHYCAPIHNASGAVVGVLITSFNWSFAQEVLDKIPLDPQCRAYVINDEGTVIASTGKRGVLRDDLSWLMAGEQATAGGSGYSIECARNGQPTAWGYCHTRGFAAYPGKRWSAVVCHPVELKSTELLLEKIQRDGTSHLYASEIANHELVEVSATIRELVRAINFINNETNMLAVNASIQAGVAGAEGESFSVIASEIGRLAKQSEEFVSIVNQLTESLGSCVHKTVAVRLADAAFDTIDKIDRNLFERNCDIQAFAKFQKLIDCAKAGKNDPSAQELLQKAHSIYEVYHDILVLDLRGTIVSAAVRTDLIGESQGDRDWFRECSRGQLVVTDLYYSKTVSNYTVTFAAPLTDVTGAIVGVITTRFNCDFIYGIMKAAIVGRESQVFLINSKGTLIGSSTGDELLERSFANLRTYKLLDSGVSGFTNELIHERHVEYTIGYAKTPGYNNYRGKGWSVLVMRQTQSDPPQHEASVIPIKK